MENFADLLLRQIRIYTQILNSLKFHANTSFAKSIGRNSPCYSDLERNGLYKKKAELWESMRMSGKTMKRMENTKLQNHKNCIFDKI